MKTLVVFLSFFLCSVITFAQSAREKTVIESNIRTVMDTQTTAWNRGDIDGFMRGYWNSEKLVFVSGDNVTHGWQQTHDRYRKNYDSKAKMGILKFSDLEINVVSKDAAIVVGSWALQREKDNPKGKFTLIFRKFKDGWRIVHDHTS